LLSLDFDDKNPEWIIPSRKRQKMAAKTLPRLSAAHSQA
jgi:hypothetical protein